MSVEDSRGEGGEGKRKGAVGGDAGETQAWDEAGDENETRYASTIYITRMAPATIGAQAQAASSSVRSFAPSPLPLLFVLRVIYNLTLTAAAVHCRLSPWSRYITTLNVAQPGWRDGGMEGACFVWLFLPFRRGTSRESDLLKLRLEGKRLRYPAPSPDGKITSRASTRAYERSG